MASLFLVTILLGRSAGADALGIFSVTLAYGYVMQAVSTAGLYGAAMNDLLKPGNNPKHQLRTIVHARLLFIPQIFLIGTVCILVSAVLQEISTTVIVLFFLAYAIGAFDVAELSHMAGGRFETIALRRIVVLIVFVPLKIWLAHTGNLELSLLAHSAESALLQIVLFKGSGITNRMLCEISTHWKAAIRRVWKIRLLWFASMISSFSRRLDLFVVTFILGAQAAGQYSAASRPIEATIVLVGSLVSVFFRHIASNSSSPRLYATHSALASRTIFWTSLLLTAGLCLAGPYFITLLYGNEFRAAAHIVAVYSLTVPFVFQQELLGVFLMIEEEYGINLALNATYIAVTLLLFIILVPQFGLMGAAIGSILVRPVSLCLVFFPNRRGRRLLAMAYGGIFLSRHRVQHTANILIRVRRRE